MVSTISSPIAAMELRNSSAVIGSMAPIGPSLPVWCNPLVMAGERLAPVTAGLGPAIHVSSWYPVERREWRAFAGHDALHGSMPSLRIVIHARHLSAVSGPRPG